MNAYLSGLIYYVCNSTHQYQSAHQFDVSSFTQCKDTIVAQNLKMGDLNLITPLSGMVCHPQARNWYNRLCQI